MISRISRTMGDCAVPSGTGATASGGALGPGLADGSSCTAPFSPNSMCPKTFINRQEWCAVSAQDLHRADQLGGGEAELGEISGGGLPFPGALGGQLAAQTDHRLDVHLLRKAKQVRKLGELLDDDEDLAPELAAHQRQPQVLLVLVAIADGERLGIRVEREHEQELALAA